MESALVSRDRIGVQDFVLLEDYQNEDAFLENLQKRFKERLIYVSHMVKYMWDHIMCDLCSYFLKLFF